MNTIPFLFPCKRRNSQVVYRNGLLHSQAAPQQHGTAAAQHSTVALAAATTEAPFRWLVQFSENPTPLHGQHLRSVLPVENLAFFSAREKRWERCYLSTASLSASCRPLPYVRPVTRRSITALPSTPADCLSVMAACCQGKSCSFKISPSLMVRLRVKDGPLSAVAYLCQFFAFCP